MTTTEPWTKDLARMHAGDRIEVWDEHHRGRTQAQLSWAKHIRKAVCTSRCN